MRARRNVLAMILSVVVVMEVCVARSDADNNRVQAKAEHRVNQSEAVIKDILHEISQYKESHVEDRPFITLTYAQSLDGKIAMMLSPSGKEVGDEEHASTSSNFPISGSESLLMTHALRSMHDAILVGGRTLFIDNPRLSNRLWEASNRQPQPIVLDTNLRYINKLGSSCELKT